MAKIIILIFVLFSNINSLINITHNHKCGTDTKVIPNEIEEAFFNRNKKLNKRKTNEEKFNIYIELTNIEEEIRLFNLDKYHDMIINSLKIAAETFTSLLKPVYQGCYNLSNTFMDKYGYTHFDKTQFGLDDTKKYFLTCHYNIDLLIFSRFLNQDDEKEYINFDILSKAYFVGKTTGRPIVGGIMLNKTILSDSINSFEYLKYYFLHSFTHILGFDNQIIKEYLSNKIQIFTKIDQDGITRKYLKSTKVIETAKKYFNCDDIDGVELEDSSDSLHWESRILLGEYMCQIGYELDQVISEFTLAFLEDTGNYVANYYTGGKMQFGKNKGCEFIKNKCVNNYEINPKFENEFFDSVLSQSGRDPSCSSGRQSRGYFGFWIRNDIPSYYQYFRDKNVGGYYYADYCPVSDNNFYEDIVDKYFVGRCDIGTGDYGSAIYYTSTKNYLSKDLESVTGEKYSSTSFCYLSSLMKNEETGNIYSNVVRAICYETFCTSKSLTVKILDIYIVCPRGGGKVNAEGFIGYFLCPDYNLICSGTVLCNNIFDCAEKKSGIKSSSYIYDYDIKTSQNIENAEIDDFDNENNYELTDDGICVKFCKQCNMNQICIKCRENYGLVGDKENDELIICKSMEEINIGYYLNTGNSIYYKCSENCEKCYDDNTCYKCIANYGLIVKEENENVICEKLENLENGYYLDENDSIYYKCNENCKKCINDKICSECNDNYELVGNQGNSEIICKLSEDLNVGYYINESNSIYYKCSENCEKCYNDNTCYQCITNYELVGNNENKNIICERAEKIENGYYINETNSIYYKCNENCNKCINDKKCSECNDNYELVGNQGNSEIICKLSEDLNIGYYINESNSIYYKCGEHCEKCVNDIECLKCIENYDLVGDKENNKLITCKSIDEINTGYYFNEEDSIFYKCDDEHCEKCYNDKICYKCETNYGLVGNKENNDIICLPLEEISSGYYKDNDLINYKCIDNCEICIDDNNCIKCKENYAKKDGINLTCYLINELRPYYFKDPKDEYNFLNCSVFFNCEICDEKQCNSNNDEEKKNNNKNIKLIIIILVCFICLIIIIIIIYCLCKTSKKQKNNTTVSSSNQGFIEKVNAHRSERSEDVQIYKDQLNTLMFHFQTTAGTEFKIFIEKEKTMEDLFKQFFEFIQKPEYIGRDDLFVFLKDGQAFKFGCKDKVMLHYNKDMNNIILITDQKNLI